jgi:hypothetical protein
LFFFKGTDGVNSSISKPFVITFVLTTSPLPQTKHTLICFGLLPVVKTTVPLNEYGEWHHLWPLCVFGSVEDDRNYRRVRPLIHIKVHAALIFFFPWIYELHLSLDILISTKEDGKKPGKVSKEVLDAALAGMVSRLLCFVVLCSLLLLVRVLLCIGYPLILHFVMGNQHGKKPPSDGPRISKKRASKIRSNQRSAKNEERALQGLPPLTPLKSGIVPTLTGDPKKDKCRASKIQSNQRRAQNNVRAQEGRSLLKRLKTGAADMSQSHLQENHPLALLQADLLQSKIEQWSTTLPKEQAKVKSKEKIVETFEYELAQEEEKRELACRKVDLIKEFGKKHRSELAAKLSTCQDAVQQVQQNTHLKNIATHLAMVSKGLLQCQSEEALKSALPFAQMQDPRELATKSNLDYKKVKDLTCRQYIGIVRHIFLFSYQFSMTYIQVGPGDREQIVLSPKTTKKKCRHVVCDMLNIAHY